MANSWRPEPEMWDALREAVPGILADQREDGRFGTSPWTCLDQHRIFHLAAAWSLENSPWFHNDEVLAAIVLGGDALIEAQDEEGMWTFLKKDYSEWGQIYMPWTYSRWIRAYMLARSGMDGEARVRWDAALEQGFEGISKTCLSHVHNIPTHHAMSLYCAGMVFEREAWKTQAKEFIHEVVAAQSPYGWWTENVGPVVSYNYVYSEAMGVYYKLSGDGRVLEALERAARFHRNYTYPDGSAVETVDERNAYNSEVRPGNPGFSHTATGRGYLARQHRLFLEAGGKFDADYAAHMLLYAGEGEIEEMEADQTGRTYAMGGDALIVSRKPWFLSLSAYCCPLDENRFRQDRQNFVSVFHESTGLIVGGGNTKLQPLWSTFSVGDTSLMRHTPGDADPDFGPFEGLAHIPDRAEIRADEACPGIDLHYGADVGRVTLVPRGDSQLLLILESSGETGNGMEAHVTLIPHLREALRSSTGERAELQTDVVEWTGADGAWFEHAGWRLSFPAGARLVWPALPHNAYTKGGEAGVGQARLVLALPFGEDRSRYELSLDILHE